MTLPAEEAITHGGQPLRRCCGRNVLNVGGLLAKPSSFLVLPGFFSARKHVTAARWLLL
jgi:hypothetical protein